jgi:hypothetical protein
MWHLTKNLGEMQKLRGMLLSDPIEAQPLKQVKSKIEIAALVAEAIKAAVAKTRIAPISIEGHIRDGLGRNWDVTAPAPTPAHRRAIDNVRDLYDLGE